jgi:hypothetical protein
MNGVHAASVPTPSSDLPPRAVATRPFHDPRRKSPVLAGLLSALPGLGQVYVGYYARGFVHAVVVGALISILASGPPDSALIPLLGMFLSFFWLYNVIDAARKAALVNLALEGIATGELPQDFPAPGFRGSITAGVLLIAAGGLLLSSTVFELPLDWLEDWWPAAPILFGGWLVTRGILERSR